VVSALDSGPDQIHVSWGPLQPERVQGYRGGVWGRFQVDTYAPSQCKATVTPLHSLNESQILGIRQPSLLCIAGTEKAMSLKACTQEGLVSLELCMHESVFWRAFVFLFNPQHSPFVLCTWEAGGYNWVQLGC